tara:strand:- start:11072 stop:11281 length:210 start_codon:yes stop_codon:yes gene_type:complete
LFQPNGADDLSVVGVSEPDVLITKEECQPETSGIFALIPTKITTLKIEPSQKMFRARDSVRNSAIGRSP